MREIWKDIYYVDMITNEIIDYKGLYQVSNFGRVKCLNYRKTEREKELNYTKDKDGYITVCLSRRRFRVHRLVAYMFIPNDNENMWQVNHKDENPENNYENNLEWCTPRYNCNYGNHNKKVSESKKGCSVWNKGVPCSDDTKRKISESNKGKKRSDNVKKEISDRYKGKNNPNAKKVSQFDVNGNLIKVWSCAKEITIKYGWNYNTFYAHLTGNLKCKNPHEYNGYLWYFNSDNYSPSEK